MAAFHARTWGEAVDGGDVLLVATAKFTMSSPGRERDGDTELHTVLVTRDTDGFHLSVGHPFGVVRMAGSASLPALLMALASHGEGPHVRGLVFGWADDAECFGASLRHWESRLAGSDRYGGGHPRTVAEFEVGGDVLSLLAADGAFRLEAQGHPRMVLCRSDEPEAILRAAGLLLDARTDRERMIVAGCLGSSVATFEAEVAEREASASPSP